MPSNWLAFDRLRTFLSGTGIYRHENLLQDQPSIDQLSSAGPERNGLQSAILQAIQVNYFRRERYKDYDKMDEMGEISLALDMYADESCVVNPDTGHIVQCYGSNTKTKNEVQQLFDKTLMIDHQCRSIVRYLCKYGDCAFRIMLNKERTAVLGLKRLDVYNFTRIETSNGDLIAFHYTDEQLNQSYFLHPWEVVHFRLSNFEARFHPYGRSVIEGGRKAFKQLILMESAAVIYRLTRAPQKRKFIIPVGNIPSTQVPEYLRKIAAQFKNKRFYNPSNGQFDERYAPLTQEDDFFLPRRPDGQGPDIETLSGADNLGQIEDIEYFLKKMVAPTKIPPSRLGIGDSRGGESDGKPLSQTSSEFAKNVSWVQQVMSVGLTKIALVHLALKGYSRDEMNSFWVSMMVSSAMEELYRIETWQTRANIMADLNELGWFPKEWILSRFTDLSPDEIEQMLLKGAGSMEDAPEMGAGGGGGSMGSGGGEDLFGGGADDVEDMFGGEDEDNALSDAIDEAGDNDEEESVGDELFGESIDSRLSKLEKQEMVLEKLSLLRRLIIDGKGDRNQSIAESLINSHELTGVPVGGKSEEEEEESSIILEGVDEESITVNILRQTISEESQRLFGTVSSDEDLKVAAQYTIIKEQRLLDEDRFNSIIDLENGVNSGNITVNDLPHT